MLVNVSIRAEIDARLAEMGMGANEVLARLASHARGSLDPFLQVSGENAWIDLTTDEAKVNLHLIKEMETERRRYGKDDDMVEEFKVKIKLHDPQAALVQLGRHHKLFTDKVEVDDSGLDDAERARRIIAILDRARARRDRQT